MSEISFFRQVVIDEKSCDKVIEILSRKSPESKTKPVFIKEIPIEDFRKAYGK